MMPALVVIDPLMEHLGQRRDVRAQVPDSEILTLAVVAATYVDRHHERAAPMMRALGSLSGRISVARVHRRLHQRADGMAWIPATVGGASPRATGSLSIAFPCRRAAKRETFVGWRLHLVRRPDGAPVRVPMRSAGVRDLRLACPPGRGGWAERRIIIRRNGAADEASILAETGVRLVPVRRATMRPHAWLMDAIELRAHRRGIEMTNGQPSTGDDGQ